METDNYPGNEEIKLQRISVLELEATNDWGAVKLAREDLYALVKEKEKWLENPQNT